MLNQPYRRIQDIAQKLNGKKLQVEMHADPYTDTANIRSIDTGLNGQWKYSPLFCQPIAETYMVLTGSRRSDYILAEEKTNTKHNPRVTVWHHVWEKNQNGEYRMQLVDYELHRGTCPHAGGCKLWSLENWRPYKSYGGVYVSRHLQDTMYRGKNVYKVGDIRIGDGSDSYGDFVIDYIFKDEEHPIQMYVYRSSKRFRKHYKLWGLDPYGNEFYSDKNGRLYFFDHEIRKMFDISLHESDVLK